MSYVGYIDGELSICPNPRLGFVEIVEMPEDSLFRTAWEMPVFDGDIEVNVEKAKEITHTKRRVKRDTFFAPHDAIIAKQVPGSDSVKAEQERKLIRTWDTNLQNQIDTAISEAELRTIITDSEL